MKQLLLIVLLVVFANGFSAACNEIDGSSSKSTGVYDLDKMSLYLPTQGMGLVKLYKWEHIESGKTFLSTKNEGYNEEVFKFKSEGGLIYSGRSPQPKNTKAIYLAFDDKFVPFHGNQMSSLLLANENGTEAEFLGYLPIKKINSLQ